ncbi:butyrophilin-like protein 2 [Pseudorasbora parva]|uniref:butyrophilin-like protein 2 n=1 Tax=Pseudorasbora parva TaxID=51549 RepID=UPI00351F4C4E
MMRSFQPSYLHLLYMLISLEYKAHTERACKQDHQLNINYVQGDDMSISCLTTTHPLETQTVKLRRTDPDTDILMYSDTSPTSEHQRWSVRNDAGHVTLDLKDIRLSDDGLYDCQVYNGSDCLKATQFNLKVIKCKSLDSVHATPNTSVLLPCPKHPLQNRTDQVTWKIVIGHQSIEISKYYTPHKSPNKPLYERGRILANGSLLIRDAVIADGSWYQCRVSETACYEVKLVMKAHTERACKQDHQLNINYVQGDNMSISCLTTTHPLETQTVKLRRTDPDTDILKYSDTSPTSEHQRWSVRNDAGHVTLDLKDIRLSDDGLYDCQVYNGSDCLKATQFNLKVIKCKSLDSVHATPNMSVLLPCPKHPLQNRTDQVTWKIVIGHQSIEISKYYTPHKSPNKPLYERGRILANGSLLIRDAVIADGSWYQCQVSETACYEVKLVMKD